MLIGQGCRVHLRKAELPEGILIVQVSKHLTTVINGVVHDTYNPAREAQEYGFKNGVPYSRVVGRCVYGYYTKKQTI